MHRQSRVEFSLHGLFIVLIYRVVVLSLYPHLQEHHHQEVVQYSPINSFTTSTAFFLRHSCDRVIKTSVLLTHRSTVVCNIEKGKASYFTMSLSLSLSSFFHHNYHHYNHHYRHHHRTWHYPFFYFYFFFVFIWSSSSSSSFLTSSLFN